MVVWMLPQEQADDSQPLLWAGPREGQVCLSIPVPAYQPGDLTGPLCLTRASASLPVKGHNPTEKAEKLCLPAAYLRIAMRIT